MKGFATTRPVVVSKKALVAKENFIQPPPNQFTHELKRRQPFYFARKGRKKADGHFEAGTQVVLLVSEGGDFCRVADGRGIYAEVRCDSLKKL